MSTKTLTVTEFLTARLDEDEAAARAVPPHSILLRDGVLNEVVGFVIRNDPARVLAEVAAKRRIVFESKWELERKPESPRARYIAGHTLRALASVYADHPDFREEWR